MNDDVVIPDDLFSSNSTATINESQPSAEAPNDLFPKEDIKAKEAQSKLDSSANFIRGVVGKTLLSGSPLFIASQILSGKNSLSSNGSTPNKLEESVGTIVDGAIQTASFGIPKTITKKILEANKLSYPEPSDKNAENIGKIIGLIAPSAAATSIAKSIPTLVGNGLAKSMIRGASEGAFVGFTEAPQDFMDIKQRIKQGAIGGVVGAAIVPLAKAIDTVAFKAETIAKDVRNSLFQAKTEIGNKFNSQLDNLIASNPNTLVNAEEAFSQAQSISRNVDSPNTRFINDLRLGAKKAGLDPDVIEGFVKNPESAREITLNQSRDIRKAISKVPSIKDNFAKGKFANFSETDRDLIDFSDHLKSAQLSAFPQLSGINKNFSESIKKYDFIKSKFKVGQLLNNMEKNFGDKEVQRMVKDILPKETIDKIGGYRNSIKLLKAAGWTGAIGLYGEIFRGFGDVGKTVSYIAGG